MVSRGGMCRHRSGIRPDSRDSGPEIALVLGADLHPAAAHAALEVVDSVWRDYRFSLELNTADGSSAAGVALGPPLRLDNLAALPVRLVRRRDSRGRDGSGSDG